MTATARRKPVTVVDTSVILMAWFGSNSREPERVRKARTWIRALEKVGHDLVVPAVALAELNYPEVEVRSALKGVLIESLDEAAGFIAQHMHSTALATARAANPNGFPPNYKSAVKYDALIAATAHACGAVHLLHCNRNDFAGYLKAATSATVAVDTDTTPLPGGVQMSILPDEEPEW